MSKTAVKTSKDTHRSAAELGTPYYSTLIYLSVGCWAAGRVWRQRRCAWRGTWPLPSGSIQAAAPAAKIWPPPTAAGRGCSRASRAAATSASAMARVAATAYWDGPTLSREEAGALADLLGAGPPSATATSAVAAQPGLRPIRQRPRRGSAIDSRGSAWRAPCHSKRTGEIALETPGSPLSVAPGLNRVQLPLTPPPHTLLQPSPPPAAECQSLRLTHARSLCPAPSRRSRPSRPRSMKP